MPEPVSTSELLLQRIADRLESIDAKLGQGSAGEATPVKEPATKSPTKKSSVRKVTGR